MKILLFLLCAFLCTGCAAKTPEPTFYEDISVPAATDTHPPETTVETVPPDPIQLLLDSMTTEEKVGQLFLARCDDTYALEHIRQYHLGGLVLFGADFQDQTVESMRAKTSAYQAAAEIPLLLAVDEEGGTVTRISRYPAFREYPFPSPRQAYSWGGTDLVHTIEEEKCQLLQSLGLNVNLGPVCDITTQRDAFLYDRSIGLDAGSTAYYAADTVFVMDSYHIGSCLKHFPGYGNNPDTHTGIAVDERSLEELQASDLIPFQSGIDAGCGAILVSHTIVEAFDPELPASLSPGVHAYLREEMGFEGVILTDDLVMEAITEAYGPEEAAVLAVLAGNDLLCSTEYIVQYEAVLAAVKEDRISEEILNRAARNVLEWKSSLGLI